MHFRGFKALKLISQVSDIRCKSLSLTAEISILGTERPHIRYFGTRTWGGMKSAQKLIASLPNTLEVVEPIFWKKLSFSKPHATISRQLKENYSLSSEKYEQVHIFEWNIDINECSWKVFKIQLFSTISFTLKNKTKMINS